MKRTGAVVRLIVCLLTAVILTGLLTAGLVWNGGFFSIGGLSYKNADDYTIGDPNGGDIELPSAGITEIEINWVKGKVKVQGSDKRYITLSETGSEDDDTTLRYLMKNGKLTVQYAKSRWFGFSSYPKKELTVYIPEDMTGLSELSLNVVDSDTSLTYLTVDDIDFDSVSGSLLAENVACTEINADTVSGNVDFTHRSDFRKPLGEIELDTVSGNLTLTVPDAPRKVECDSVSGDVTLSFTNCKGFTASFDRVNGNFTSDFPFTERDDQKIFGDGSSKFNFDTVSGRLRIIKA